MKKKVIILGGIGIGILIGSLIFYFFYLGNPTRQALAHVNGEKINVEHFNNELAKVEEPLQSMYREEPEKLLEGIVIKTLLIQEAKKQGIVPPVKTYKDGAKDSLPPD